MTTSRYPIIIHTITSTFPSTPLAYSISTGYTDYPTWHILIHMYLLWGGYVIYIVWSTSYLPLPSPHPLLLSLPRSLHIFRQWIVHLHSSHALPKYFDSARTYQRGGGTGGVARFAVAQSKYGEYVQCASFTFTYSVCGAPRVGGPTEHIGNRLSFYIICERTNCKII